MKICGLNHHPHRQITENIALVVFREPEKPALKDRVVQIQTHRLIFNLIDHLIRASNSSKFASSGGFPFAYAIASEFKGHP